MNEIAMGIDNGGSHVTCQLYNVNTNFLVSDLKVNYSVNGKGAKKSILNFWNEVIGGISLKFERVIAMTLWTGFDSTFIKNGLPLFGIDRIPNGGFLYHITFCESIADDYFSAR